MRRLLIGLVLLTVVCIVSVFIAARGDEEPKGETERGAPGFPLRGSLADDSEAIDTAVGEWREETAEDAKEAEEDDDDDDAETRARHARRPDESDDVTVLATEQASEQLQEERDFADDQPPALSVEWTGEVPGYEHAALVLHGDTYSGQRAAVVGYGDRPARSEDKDEGTIRLGTAGKPPYTGTPNTFAAGAFTAFDNFPYLVLAGAGEVKTVHALVGTDEIDRKGPVAIIDARRFDERARPDSVFLGRTGTGSVVSPLQ